MTGLRPWMAHGPRPTEPPTGVSKSDFCRRSTSEPGELLERSSAGKEAERPRLARSALAARRRSPGPFARLLALSRRFERLRASTRGLTSGSCPRRCRPGSWPPSFLACTTRTRPRADHSTLDDLARVFLLVTVGAFPLRSGGGLHRTDEVLLFWVFADRVCHGTARAAARLVSRRTLAYLQNAVIVGAGDIGQLVARKLLQHP